MHKYMGNLQKIPLKEDRFINALFRVEMNTIEYHLKKAAKKILADGKIPNIAITSHLPNDHLLSTEIYIRIY